MKIKQINLSKILFILLIIFCSKVNAIIIDRGSPPQYGTYYYHLLQFSSPQDALSACETLAAIWGFGGGPGSGYCQLIGSSGEEMA